MVMGPYIYWLAGDPRYRDHARRSNEAQAAAWVGAFRAIGGGIGRLGRWIASVPARFARRHRHARTLRELQELDDRLLQDIGLDRADLWSAARTPRPRPDLGRPLPRPPSLVWSAEATGRGSVPAAPRDAHRTGERSGSGRDAA